MCCYRCVGCLIAAGRSRRGAGEQVHREGGTGEQERACWLAWLGSHPLLPGFRSVRCSRLEPSATVPGRRKTCTRTTKASLASPHLGAMALTLLQQRLASPAAATCSGRGPALAPRTALGRKSLSAGSQPARRPVTVRAEDDEGWRSIIQPPRELWGGWQRRRRAAARRPVVRCSGQAPSAIAAHGQPCRQSLQRTAGQPLVTLLRRPRSLPTSPPPSI